MGLRYIEKAWTLSFKFASILTTHLFWIAFAFNCNDKVYRYFNHHHVVCLVSASIEANQNGVSKVGLTYFRFSLAHHFRHIFFVGCRQFPTTNVASKKKMKLSIATAVLTSCAVNAFQQPALSTRQITSLNTIALNPFGNNKVESPQEPEQPKKKDESFDMTGIAVSVS